MAIYGLDLNANAELKDEFVKHAKQIRNIKNPNSSLTLLSHLYRCLSGDDWNFPNRSLNFFTRFSQRQIKEKPRGVVAVESKATDFIDLLVAASEDEKKLAKQDETEAVLSEEVLVSQCIAAILATSHLQANILPCSLYALSANQDIQERLYQDIKTLNFDSELVSLEQVQNAPYLDLFISEVLRFFPTEFRLERVCTQTVRTENLKIDEGTEISIPLFALHHNEENYKNPDKFDPDRFRSDSEKINPFNYLPFGQAGSKINQNLQLVILTAKLTIATLVESFKFSQVCEFDFKDIFDKGITGVPRSTNFEVICEKRK